MISPKDENKRDNSASNNGDNIEILSQHDKNNASTDNLNMEGEDSESSDFFSQPEGKNGSSTNCEVKQVRQLAREETTRVDIWRVVVIGSILVVGVIVSTLTFFILDDEHKADGDTAFILFANTIEDSFKAKMKSIFESNRALGRYITIHAFDQKFPYVNVPGFEVQASGARRKADLGAIAYAPAAYNTTAWMEFAVETMGWLEESKMRYDELEPGLDRSREPVRTEMPPTVFRFDPQTGEKVPWMGRGTFYPRLYTSPPPRSDGDGIIQNEDLMSDQQYRPLGMAATALKDAVFSPFHTVHKAAASSLLTSVAFGRLDAGLTEAEEKIVGPFSISAQPVYRTLSSSEVVGFIFSYVKWEKYLQNVLPDGVEDIFLVLKNTCDQAHTFELKGKQALYLGEGDLHDEQYEARERAVHFTENYFNPDLAGAVGGHCEVYIDIYPSAAFDARYDSRIAIIFSTVISSLFAIMAAIFVIYDRFVTYRNEKFVSAAARSNAIVSSLFPSNVKDRLLAEKEEEDSKRITPQKSTLKGFLSGETDAGGRNQDTGIFKTKPIADLFPDTTVFFGDIVGFTAWSSVREPTQVFTLLETLYHAFDEIATRRRVFKVETVGDCYVAVCGLPDPRNDHAVNMCRFARDCMYRTWELTKRLEVLLGPDTGDLSMRMGLHSGPVTAGVLRGERSRFQLFGDTMNTAARMESNGKKSRIHLSQETVDLLMAAGKSSWVTAREDKIIAKGKGEMQTYWLDLVEKNEATSNKGESGHPGVDDTQEATKVEEVLGEPRAKVQKKIIIDGGKNDRLVSWNVDVLLRLLKQVIANRKLRGKAPVGDVAEDLIFTPARGQIVLDEVKEIITLPRYDTTVVNTNQEIESTVLKPEIVEELHAYVVNIAQLYRNNPFHNFEHASHVTMSVVKLLSRIVAPSEHDCAAIGKDFSLHDHTYGITSDPLTQFACVLSALIHDLDHPGVPNAQLVKECTQISSVYKNKSVAEQNSVDIAWHLLMDERFSNLRTAIYTDEIEMNRFRQLVVNSVMATDIVDKELKNLRNARWEKAFSETKHEEDEHDTINRKATIVIEHLIQASDVAHTMQHWHVYRKWNERFFHECYKAYKEGRADSDPTPNWYKGEIGFFDFYIIPLAKKLKNCGVFGVSSDEYLNYAMKNRQEWEQRGEQVVAEMIEKIHSLWDDEPARESQAT